MQAAEINPRQLEWFHLLVHDVIFNERIPFRHCQG